MHMKHFFLFFLSLLSLLVFLAVQVLAEEAGDQRLDTIKYGTETEIAALIGTLKTDTTYDGTLDGELIALSGRTRNRNILTGLLSFFADRKQPGLEERAIRAIEERDEENPETVLAAIDYLGKVKAASAIGVLKQLLDAQEARFMGAAFRALGQAASGGGEAAEYLIDFYTNRNPGEENRRELLTALGETGSKDAVSLLAGIAENNGERGLLRIAALEALSKIGDEAGLPAILIAASSPDPNVRSAAIGALGPFSGQELDDALLEGFRDSYYRTRMAAAKAAGQRKFAGAIPYLRFRAEQDEVPAVREEAVRALGAIGNADALHVLDGLFSNRKNAEKIRLLAAEMLIGKDPGSYLDKLIAELDDAKKANQTNLYNGFLRVASLAKSGRLEDLARRLLVSGNATEKSYGLDMVAANEFRALAPEVRVLAEKGGLAAKARSILTKMGANEE
jgi:HEAT repeat protein